MQEISSAAAAAPVPQILVEQQVAELPTTTEESEDVKKGTIRPQPSRRRKKVLPKRPLKKQATISVKDDETAAIKAGMDLALGIAGKEHKKYVRPNKVRVAVCSHCQCGHIDSVSMRCLDALGASRYDVCIGGWVSEKQT